MLAQLFRIALQYLAHLNFLRLQLLENPRRWWVRPDIREESREQFGAYSTIFTYFKVTNEEQFKKLVGMTVAQFDRLHGMIRHLLQKRSFRKSLPSELRLACVLNCLVHGVKATQQAWFYRIGKSTMYKLIPEVCKAIFDALKNHVMSFPEKEDFIRISNEIYRKYGMPNCIGIIDGKHFRIKAPPHSGTLFYNFKKFYSIVFLGICDAKLKFVWGNCGNYGSTNDTTSFLTSNVGQALANEEIDFPATRALPNTDIQCECFLIGDGGFPLRKYLITLFRNSNVRRMLAVKKIFNARLSNARKIIERAFGIICRRWKVFDSPMDFNLSTSDIIIMCTVCLHNFLIEDESDSDIDDSDSDSDNENGDTSSSDNNREDNTIDGRETTSDEENQDQFDDPVLDGDDEMDVDDENDANAIRNKLANYFLSPAGNLQWQWDKL